MRWLRAALFVALLGGVARAQQVCPPGEAWDPGMSMCMPLPPSGQVPSAPLSNAIAYDLMISPDGCGSGSYFHFGMSMCLPKPTRLGHFSGMAMGNLFLALDAVEGPRGTTQIVAPNWAMFDLGVDLARWNRLELDVMLTAERWLLPGGGYPLLLQIGEENSQGLPFIDAQHPHSSPLMGLTLTDVFSFSAMRTRIVRVFFAPRGESTDGPIPMMHRPTGTPNPDAPLGHHVGQDVGHVTSTVIGISVLIGHTLVEASTFHGLEPSPTRVDLPIGVPNSAALRIAQQIGQRFLISASVAYVTDPEGDPAVPHEWRISASGYTQWDLPHRWRGHGTLIWGGITDFDHATFLSSITGEWAFLDDANNFWGRAEALQRTPNELAIVAPQPEVGQWVGALTIGYTRRLTSLWAFDFSVGGSATVSFVPGDYRTAYGGSSIFSGKLFLEARMMKMFAAGRR
jgi:hypothetical protein